MNELIRVNYDSERPTISGRELHEALEIKTAYKDWFPRMCEYGFTEGTDFCSFLSESTGGRPSTDHQITIPMAKELCTLQRNERGRQLRQYFIQIEESWDSPEMVMKRALEIANQRVEEMRQRNNALETTVALQTQQITEMKPKVTYYDIVLNCSDLVSTAKIAKDYGRSTKWLNIMLGEMGVQFKQNGIWLLYQKYAIMGYTRTKTHIVNGRDGLPHIKVHTYWTQKGRLFIYNLLKRRGILPIIEVTK